ncbi:threonine ammonia-lyase [Streptomyces litchfieldiae]|uniref:Pyridoxal-phosphate dependent enzyme n=1 Tax=Streptomyces litchfieldiae TaxID=3075543 RepID=A0ABU2MJ63_9ACTN|nr:pyridoxal-phosphate dependent enzyme [Streptomyces sp. DSM 44938]MDT0341645.1 pyridoxal-phosphate dependent enzyme [Streptomyces sp. DSM 44938]
MPQPLVDVDQIAKAAACVTPVFRDTPQFLAERLGEAVGVRTLLKVETVNPIRCFKGRGTDFLARTRPRGDVLVCASAGNLGQGLAYSGREHGLSTVIFSAPTVTPDKLAAMRRLGAQVHLVDGDFDAARQSATAAAERHGWTLVEDGSTPPLAEGAGTIAVELTRGGPVPDVVLVPAGNGSLACGVAAWFKSVAPSTRVIAVGAAGAPATQRAWHTGDMAPSTTPTTTIAEGLAGRVPAPRAVADMRATVDEFILVSDHQLLDAMRLLLRTTGLIAEPSGAAALAGAAALSSRLADALAAVVITGANADHRLLLPPPEPPT